MKKNTELILRKLGLIMNQLRTKQRLSFYSKNYIYPLSKYELRLFNQVTKNNQCWIADYSSLTRKYGHSTISKVRYGDKPKPRGNWKGRKEKNLPYLPKYFKYSLVGENRLNSVPVYDHQVYIFTIMDAYSRFILHSCLKHAPKDFSFQFPSRWFDPMPCFSEALRVSKAWANQTRRFYKPFHLILDSDVSHSFQRKLESQTYACTYFSSTHPLNTSPLEAFFLNVQKEFKAKLTNRNFQNYLDRYNYERENSYGFIPAHRYGNWI